MVLCVFWVRQVCKNVSTMTKQADCHSCSSARSSKVLVALRVIHHSLIAWKILCLLFEVLFNVLPGTSVQVSVPVDKD